MSSFCRKVVEYMYDIKLNQFLSSFREIHRRYGDLDADSFFREWFDRSIIRELIFYFSPSAIIRSFEEVKTKREKLYKTYVRIYWSASRRYPAKVEEALRFFGLREISEEALKSRYREMVRKYHPDRAGKNGETHRRMVKINYYYQVPQEVHT
ncbi:MAG: DnaJ domain-containing protein [Aquificota bacterium]|nr:DnaJ domain-containing protein [Aquificota bacterium]